jgi:hypothetical protein
MRRIILIIAGCSPKMGSNIYFRSSMTRVLLITDTERVLRIFESLEAKGVLQLRTVATLDQADQEISVSAADFTFVQSRVSGFSTEIQLRHLVKVLPEGAKTVVLAADAVDATQAKKEHTPYIELSLDDEALEETISSAITGVPRVLPEKTAEEGRNEDGEDAISASSSTPEGPPASEEPAETEALAASADAEPVEDNFFEEPSADAPAQEMDAEEPLAALPAQEADTEAPSAALPVPDKDPTKPFAEIMKLREAEIGASLGGSLQVEDEVSIGAPRSSVEEFGTPLEAFEEQNAASLPDGYSRGIPLADAMARAEKKKRPYWIIPVVLVVIAVPVLSYLQGKKEAPLHDPVSVSKSGKGIVKTPGSGNTATSTQVAKQPAPGQSASQAPIAAPVVPGMATPPPQPQPEAKAVAKPAEKPAAKPEPSKAAKAVVPPVAKVEVKQPAKVEVKQAAKVEVKQPAKVEVKQAAKVEVKQPAKVEATPGAKAEVKPAARPAPAPAAVPVPVAKAGLKRLPPLVASAKLDASYAKTHPGWQRYTDSRAEYSIYKENDSFRALQVIALGKDHLDHQLFTRLLQEFAGIKRFELRSSVEKGDYQVDRGVAEGGVSLTIYRKKKDLKVKGLVLYYRDSKIDQK